MTSEFVVAVHALVYLHHRDETVASEELAGNVCTNPARVRKVMALLKKSGMVYTKEGKNGGYHIGRGAEEITLEQVSEALGVEMIKAPWQSGNIEMKCMIASGTAGVMDELTAELNELCRQRLAQLTIKDLENRILRKE